MSTCYSYDNNQINVQCSPYITSKRIEGGTRWLSDRVLDSIFRGCLNGGTALCPEGYTLSLLDLTEKLLTGM